jgi:hypothetical protein
MILLAGALVSAYLGYRLAGWWAPAAVACVALALQAAAYQGVLSTADGVSGFVQILVMTGLTSLFLFYAIFSMGRSLGLRWRRKRR